MAAPLLGAGLRVPFLPRGIVISQKIGKAIHRKQGFTRQHENDFFKDTWKKGRFSDHLCAGFPELLFTNNIEGVNNTSLCPGFLRVV